MILNALQRAHSKYCVRCDGTQKPPRSISRSQRLRQQGTTKLTPEQRIEQQRQLQRELIEQQQSKRTKILETSSTDPSVERLQPRSTPLVDDDAMDDATTVTAAASLLEERQTAAPDIVNAEVVPSSPHNRPMTEEEQQIKEELIQKSRILMQIMQAGSTVESVIAQYQNEIDDTMLELLQKRIDAARRLERTQEVVEGLILLYRRLKNEVDKSKATPAMKLLDTVLRIINDDSISQEGKEYKTVAKNFGLLDDSVRSQVVAKIKAAFGTAPLQTDVLSLAAQLAAGGEAVVDALMEEQVDASQFIEEVKNLLEDAMKQQQELKAVVLRLPENSSEREKVHVIVEDREEALEQVQEILSIAISVKREI